jgi:hypothetical protein
LMTMEDPQPSPARAINVGLGQAKGQLIGVMIDGARLVTPGLGRFALAAAALAERTVITTPPWVIGSDTNQTRAMQSGLTQAGEDALLAAIDWPNDGYRLFEVSTPAGTGLDGWFGLLAESNALFMQRRLWDEIGGADERFDHPAGGFLNLDLLRSAYELPDVTSVSLLGEASFHQIHGDLDKRASSERMSERNSDARVQYQVIRGRPWGYPVPPPEQLFVGRIPSAAVPLIRQFIGEPLTNSVFKRPIAAQPQDQAAGALVERVLQLVQREVDARRFGAATEVCRLALARLGHVPQVEEILRLQSRWLPLLRTVPSVQVEIQIARGDCLRLLDETSEAAAEYRAALAIDPKARGAHIGLAHLEMPDPGYIWYLRKIHETIRPNIYLEIGVAEGTTLALARPPTIAIGVDPKTTLTSTPLTDTRVFPQTSDDFFASAAGVALFAEYRVDFAFIDGLHQFEQALRDFTNIEKWSRRETVVAVHDTLPLNELTQRREQESGFWTGDVWKLVIALKDRRPDLDICTVPVFPAGLTLITGLAPASHVLTDEYDAIVKAYVDAPFAIVEDDREQSLNVVRADWPSISARLNARLR